MTKSSLVFVLLFSISALAIAQSDQPTTRTYPIVDTGQDKCFDNRREIKCPEKGQSFYGQDAQFDRLQPSLTDNGDGTVTDNVTGLMWTKAFRVMDFEAAKKYADDFELAGHDDWRLPSIKELYSIILFSGVDVGREGVGPDTRPFIDDKVFDFRYGANGSRDVDTQFVSSTVYTGKTMNGDATVFGLNQADGRIKGYPITDPRTRKGKEFSVRLVRGNSDYGKNDFVNNGDGTITDRATGLMWAKNDSGQGMNWEEALHYAQKMNASRYLGHSDWRLPNAKELHSIVDYSRSPQKSDEPAIDPIFHCTPVEDENGTKDWPFYWTSTTHITPRGGDAAVYIAFGEAMGFMRSPQGGSPKLMDVHGAGAQRSDPKSGDPKAFPTGRGPQGDVIRINNFVRLVRDAEVKDGRQ